ncbi:transcription initiation factor iia subunit 1 isoform 2 [Vairimorpha apis BRL 01]|uniref:Transcription initiation factor iia subunit 1 isoform 2 n=1 Tax=Vairimorpha apis BRL 01 TaxID=1037528 RepID=T0L5B8_9MICR|nr:transcription initiation factor iia subunit 1 isoform 2 [Vairimorpha apis BRL 01]
MNLEMSRIYKELIEEVLLKLELEGEPEGIGRNVIYDIQKGWTQNIRDWYETDHNDDFHINETQNIQKQKNFNDLSYEDEMIISSDEEYEMMEDTNNFLMSMYVKVTRTKCKYKLILKQGFINMGNIDYAFSNAQGELEW